ncbi:MAG: hypothetical protein VYC96_01000, partial [Actinomycetota bacterium]|nr:hypothetical protein [Actinomycetota bacterium]
VCRLIRAVSADISDTAATASARRALIEYLAPRSGNALQVALIDEVSLALARALKTHDVPADRHPHVESACADLEDAFLRRDADAAEQACRRMYWII